MASVNIQILTGSVGTVNELKGTEPNQVLSFSIATSDYVGAARGENGTNYKTHWHDVTVFGKLAVSLAKRLGKGDLVSVAGPRLMEEFTRKDGSLGTSWRVKANEAQILKSKNAVEAQPQAAAATATAAAGIVEEDIPF